WLTCGGQALHETKQVQSVTRFLQSWGRAYPDFPSSSSRWSLRGGGAVIGSSAGVFSSYYNTGNSGSSGGFRAVLISPTQ
ncbi:MAG: hypothetical protein Q4C83_01420, partial [Candidatus Saccharibacteria bacterium]|nr:hypothetical protein [Candidatus Saccharibacteria bacterium]